MYRLLSLVSAASLVAASAIQQPLRESETPLISTKELVSSTALEAHITKENLLDRAKQLFKIAELGAEEYNHPTRVIGSKGTPRPPLTHASPPLLITVVQDTLLRLTTSTRRSQTLETTTRSATRLSMPLLAMSSNRGWSLETENPNPLCR
jgi:hypothetical protein